MVLPHAHEAAAAKLTPPPLHVHQHLHLPKGARQAAHRGGAEPAAPRTLTTAVFLVPPPPPPLSSWCAQKVLGKRTSDIDHCRLPRPQTPPPSSSGSAQKVLGKRHTEVALSLQQCGISLLGLGRHADAEAKLLESLSIRVSALGENHNLVANTQRQLADLYRAWARPSDAARHLRKMLSIGDALGWAPGHKKLTAAARDLAELAPEEASALATKYRLADTKL
eukprot:365531-Chlamydomonas_euryale.AAC.14